LFPEAIIERKRIRNGMSNTVLVSGEGIIVRTMIDQDSMKVENKGTSQRKDSCHSF
jgi:hypothetical protein